MHVYMYMHKLKASYHNLCNINVFQKLKIYNTMSFFLQAAPMPVINKIPGSWKQWEKCTNDKKPSTNWSSEIHFVDGA